jgi:hypothetical protein
MRPNKIYIYIESARRDLQNDEIYQMSRSIKCRDLRNFLESKKIEVIKFFF